MAIRSNEVDGSNITFDNPGDVLFTQTIFSTMCWCNLYSGGSNPSNRAIILMWDNPASKSWAIRSDTTGALVMRAAVSFDGAANDTVVGTTVLALDTWFHFGMDFDGTDINIWLNGIFEATLGSVGTVFDDDEDFGIGGTGDGGNQMDTEITDTRYYERLLSAAEWLTISTARGHDGIVDGLVGRMILNDREPGILVTAKNPVDQGPLQVAYGTEFGIPVPSYVLDGGFSFRKRV